MEGSEDNSVVYPMPVESELHFIVGEMTTDVSCELMTGFAECMGSELEKNKVYAFPPSSSVVIFSWHGCTVKVKGKTENVIVKKDSMKFIYLSLHMKLEVMRVKAALENSKGPVSLVVGPVGVGKSSFCRFLLNYAVRLGREPIYVNLDVAESCSVSIPGTISVVHIQKQLEVCEDYQKYAALYPFGYESPARNINLYFVLVKKLGELILNRQKTCSKKINFSGTIIDTNGWVSGDGYQALTLAATAFHIDVLFVIGDEELHNKLKKDMPSSVQVVFIYKQYGINQTNLAVRSRNRDISILKYFHGAANNLKTYSINVKFHEIEIYKICQRNFYVEKSSNITPEYFQIFLVNIGPDLVNRVLGLSSAYAVKYLWIGNLQEFAYIKNVDMENRYLTILSRKPEPLPRKFLLMGDLKLKHARF